jgi:hypothetical protein
VTYNNHKWTIVAATGPTNFAPPDWNWWTDNGACDGGGATPTHTATPTPTTGGATPTNTPTTSGGGGSSRNYTAAYWTQGTDPSTNSTGQGDEWTAGATCSGGSCQPAWNSTTAYNGGAQVSRSCGGGGGGNPTATNTATPTPTNSGGGGGIGSIVSSSQFDSIWPPSQRSSTYTYNDFVTAANSYYPALCGTGDTNVKKRECAAYFANKDQETGVGQYDRELYCQPGGGGYGSAACNYCDPGNQPCGACAGGQQYWGRHSIQLSWNYNYCNGGNQISVNLHATPNEIFTNRVTGWRLADWYWMTQLGPAVTNGYGTWPMISAHDAITATHSSGNYGFAGTIRAINGGIECGSRVQQQLNRVTYYNGSGTDEEDSSGGVLGILGYTGGTFGRRFCAP